MVSYIFLLFGFPINFSARHVGQDAILSHDKFSRANVERHACASRRECDCESDCLRGSPNERPPDVQNQYDCDRATTAIYAVQAFAGSNAMRRGRRSLPASNMGSSENGCATRRPCAQNPECHARCKTRRG